MSGPPFRTFKINAAMVGGPPGEELFLVGAVLGDQAAVVALADFLGDATMLEPAGWNRSSHGALFRRRPNLDPEEEYVAP